LQCARVKSRNTSGNENVFEAGAPHGNDF